MTETLKCNNCPNTFQSDEIGCCTISFTTVTVVDSDSGNNIERAMWEANLCPTCFIEHGIDHLASTAKWSLALRKPSEEDYSRIEELRRYEVEVTDKWCKANDLGLVK